MKDSTKDIATQSMRIALLKMRHITTEDANVTAEMVLKLFKEHKDQFTYIPEDWKSHVRNVLGIKPSRTNK